MATTKTYEEERAGYYKVLVGLLILTAVTLVQPTMFLTDATFATQLVIGAIKAWMIVMYYMHLKSEESALIGQTVAFAIFLVAFIFMMIAIDVSNFQFADVSHITSEITSAGAQSASSH